jgi:UDP-glucose 4-epimerase
MRQQAPHITNFNRLLESLRDGMSDFSTPQHCIVTGGAGFIGSHLVDALLARGHAVTAVDNLSTGHAENLRHARQNPRFRFVEADVSDRQVMAPLVAHCDAFYHLASYVGVKLASQTSSQTILNNLRAIDTVLDLATHYKPRFLLTSTSEIYGKALDADGAAASLPEHADRVYGATEVHRWSYAGVKAVEEFLTLAKHHEEGLHTVIVRLFNVIGPRQVGRHGPVVPRFVEQALAHEPITVYGTGAQRRCFTFIDDAIQAILLLMGRDDTAGEVFNVGGVGPVSVRELAEAIIRLAGSRSELRFVPYESVFGARFEDVHTRIPDTGKLEAWAGFAIRRSLDDILQRILDAHPSRVGTPR